MRKTVAQAVRHALGVNSQEEDDESPGYTLRFSRIWPNTCFKYRQVWYVKLSEFGALPFRGTHQVDMQPDDICWVTTQDAIKSGVKLDMPYVPPTPAKRRLIIGKKHV